ncbi:MAG: TlpA disulfide reductase family protein [bacterium]|nr:TlpA disulfide reductase family protein [bacterium]
MPENSDTDQSHIGTQKPVDGRDATRSLKHSFAIAVIVLALIAGGVFLLRYAREAFRDVVTVDAPLVTSPVPKDGSADSSLRRGLGEVAPDVTFEAAEGESVRLFDLRGKPVVLAFYASWNVASLEAVRLLSDQAQALDKSGIAAFAVASLEPAEQAKFFVERGGYAAKVLADESGAAGEAFQLATLPAFFFIDASGILKDRQIGLLTQEEFTVKAFSLLNP